MTVREVKISVSYHHPEVGKGDLIYDGGVGGWKCGEGVRMDLTGNVVVHEDVEIQDGVQIFTHRHHWRHSCGRRAEIQRVTAHDLTIEKDVFIGAGAMLIGVERIGRGAVIGGGAVVRKREIGEFEIWIGNPAQLDGVRGETIASCSL